MTELSAVGEAAVETARPPIDARRHTFTVDLSPQPVRLVADPLRLSQVLANLLTNAAKYTDPEGTIHLRATLVDDFVTVSVIDTGLGIPKGALENVFAMPLSLEGHKVEMVHDGHAALESLESFQPEIALLDIGMPGLNGYELAKRIQQGSLGRVVTLIAVTGWGQDNDKAQALAAGSFRDERGH